MVRRRNQALGRTRVRTLNIRGTGATRSAGIVNGILVGSATWDAGSLVDAAGESKDITVTGAALGDFVIISLGVDIVDMTISGQVTAANVVTARIQNESGGTVDLASTTVKAMVIKTAAF